jgi:hypothetical protein
MDDLFNEIFGDVKADVVELNDTELYQHYAMSLYDRIHRISDKVLTRDQVADLILASNVGPKDTVLIDLTNQGIHHQIQYLKNKYEK